MITIDASVWVAVDMADEEAHDDALALMRTVVRDEVGIHQPWLSIVETSAAIARRTQDTYLANLAARHLREMPGVVFQELDERTATMAAAIASSVFLRGADAIYAAVAVASGSTLISRDAELLARAAPVVTAMTPRAWLDRVGD